MIEKLVVSSLLLLSTVASSAQDAASKHPTMGKALSIFEQLYALSAISVTKDFIEKVAGMSLTAPPDPKYPPELLKQLNERGIPLPPKPAYVVGLADINDEIRLKAQFAKPRLFLSLVGDAGHVAFPSNPIEESINIFAKQVVDAQDASRKKHCVRWPQILAIVQSNGWTMYEHPLAGEVEADDGNFYFKRLGDLSTITMDEGCLTAMEIRWAPKRQ